MILVAALIISIFFSIIRFEILQESPFSNLSIFYISFLKLVLIYIYFYICSFYLTNLQFLKKIQRKIFFFLIAISSLMAIYNTYENAKIADHLLFLFIATVALIAFYSGETIFRSIYNLKPLQNGEIEKAFISFPPRNLGDLLFLYLLIAGFIILPILTRGLWSKIAIAG